MDLPQVGVGAGTARAQDVGRPVDSRRQAVQRAFDLAVTVLLLPAALAVGAVIAVAVAIDSHGPVFYRSIRIGRGGRPFAMLKFRTMRHGVGGPSLTAHGDERQTPFGRFLARARLDELPQLWNVIKGDMRLVGPRPEVQAFVLAERDSYERILRVAPGLTGPTQLAYAGEGALLASAADREALYRDHILPAKVRLDLDYVESATLVGDLKVIALTCVLPFVARGSGTPNRAVAFSAVAVAALLGLFVAEAGDTPW
jgi:lipopolysaccharide/colanic/teichoic acid biosynthesis glycosyltransferase